MNLPPSLREHFSVAPIHPANVGGVFRYATVGDPPEVRAEIARWAEEQKLAILAAVDLQAFLVADGEHEAVLSLEHAFRPERFPLFLPVAASSLEGVLAAANATHLRVGDMGLDPRHPGDLMNFGQGTVEEIVQLVSLVKQRVRDTLGIQLREHFSYYGFV